MTRKLHHPVKITEISNSPIATIERLIEEKMTKSKHTPTPWTLDTHKYTDDGNKCRTFVIHGKDYAIGRIQGPFAVIGKDAEKEANAAFIVRACNAHDELVRALETAETYFNEYAAETPASAHTLHHVRAALAKAKGEA